MVMMVVVVVMVIAAVLMGVVRVVPAGRRFEALVTAEILMQVVMQAGRSVHCGKRSGVIRVARTGRA